MRFRLIAWLLLSGGCGGGMNAATAPPPPSSSSRPAVLVIDDGFDTSLPVFKGRIAAAYTVTCRETPDGGAPPDDGGAPPDDGGVAPDGGAEEAKAALIAALAVPDDSCHLIPGVAPKENPFADLEGDRLRWNQDLRNDVNVLDAGWKGLLETVAKRIDDGAIAYHGTATAGIIAQDTPGVPLVLVERPLASGPGDVSCFTQEEVDRTVALLSSPDVRQAYLARPPASLDRELDDVIATHGVELVNESYGRASRFAVENLLDDKRCKPHVSLGALFAVMNELDRAREEAHPGGPLLVKAAGNDGALTRGPADSLDCRIGDPRRLTIGSYDTTLERSKFTNFGPCVDAYAPGELVVAPLPGDWLFLLSGTSFAAPLVTRLVASTAPTPFDPAAARASVLALRGLNGYIPVARFPPALLYHPKPRGGQALTVAPPPAPALPREPISRRALAALRLVSRHP